MRQLRRERGARAPAHAPCGGLRGRRPSAQPRGLIVALPPTCARLPLLGEVRWTGLRERGWAWPLGATEGSLQVRVQRTPASPGGPCRPVWVQPLAGPQAGVSQPSAEGALGVSGFRSESSKNYNGGCFYR